MSRERETNLALFVDFDNVALGARDARQRFDVKLLLQRVLEKGKIIVKRAYADWHYYKEHMSPLHEAAIELIEIPMPRISGKNSADIKLVVDAMDLCYSKDHIDTFVIVSGDSDFSPLVSKLRENNKRVIGIGVKNSSSKLLINNCDEFIFYDDIYRDAVGPVTRKVTNVPADKRDLFDFLVATAQSLLQESRGVLYSSLVKDTMTRKQPDFNERNFGYSNFGELLEEARRLGLLIVERDARAGGTWVVQGLGEEEGKEAKEAKESTPAPGTGTSRSSRRRRSRGRGRGGDRDKVAQEAEGGEGTESQADSSNAKTSEVISESQTSVMDKSPRSETSQADGRKADEQKAEAKPGADKKPAPRRAAQKKAVTTKAPAKKAPTKKVVAKKAPTKKATTKKAGTKKVTAKKVPTKKALAQKTPTKKAPAKKAPAKKATTKKAVSKKAPTKKAVTKKAPARKTSPKKPVRKKSSD